VRREFSIIPRPFSSSFLSKFSGRKNKNAFFEAYLQNESTVVDHFFTFISVHSNLIKYTPIYPQGVRISQKVGTPSIKLLSDFPEIVLTSRNGRIARSSPRGFPENQKVMEWSFIPF